MQQPRQNKFWNLQNKAEKKEAELLLYGNVGDMEGWDDVVDKTFVAELEEKAKDVDTINVRVNSPGGYVFAGQAIYTALRRQANLGKHINGYVDGLAASIASVILMACDTVYMPKNALIMVHKPWTLAMGDAESMRKEAEVLDQVEKTLIAAYQAKTGLEEEEIKNIIAAETWFTAEEAKEKGFVDVIETREIAACLKGDKVIAVNGQEFDMSKFGSFDPKRFGVEPEPQQPPKPEAKAQVSVTSSNSNDKKEKTKMVLELDEEKVRAEAQKAAQERVNAIVTLGKEYKAESLAMDFVQNGKSVEEFKSELIKTMGGTNGIPTSAKVNNENIGMSQNEIQKFSFLNLCRALAHPQERAYARQAAFEFEACTAAAEKYGSPSNGGVSIPLDVLRAPIMNTTGDVNLTLGATLIPEETRLQSFIEMLVNKSHVMGVATKLGNLIGDINIPSQTGGMTGYMVGEDSEPTSSQPAYSEIQLRMKTVGGKARITRSMMKQTSLDMEMLIRRDLALALALKIDSQALYGDGSTNNCKGIKFMDGINTKEFAAASPTFAELVDMETAISIDNADVPNMAYMLNPTQKGYFKKTLKFSGVAGTIWEPGNKLNEYDALVTNQITAGDMFFGDWAQLLIGMWGGLELLVDPFTESTKGATRITAFQDIDINARHKESFCFGSTNLSGTTGTTTGTTGTTTGTTGTTTGS